MLTRLVIENIALVRRTELTLKPGLSVLTGETGAGKSVIVTALALSLGERGDREFVRHGADRATVTAGFEPEMMEICREISSTGASRARINGRTATLTQLRQATSELAEIVGQHANQMLMNEDNHLLFLDRFASLLTLRDELTQTYTRWQCIAGELRQTRNQREKLKRDRELLLFQKDEIEKAQLRPGEEEQLIRERKILDSARNLMASAAAIGQTLDDDDNSVTQLLGQVRRELESMSTIDTSLQEQLNTFTEVEFQIEEMRRFMQQYGSSLEDDPHRLEEINLRLDEIYNLKKKYGGSEEAILTTLDQINERLRDRPDIDSVIGSLEQEHETLYRSYCEQAAELSQARRKAARQLQRLVVGELGELAIDNCGFEIEFIYEDGETDGVTFEGRSVKPFPHGLENGCFLFSANPGAPLKSLVKTASGGEISRVLLALKSAERQHQRLSQSLLVFDEVDAGIGGKTATRVARKLKKLSRDCQVLVITHLHQIARLADNHYVAEKTTTRGDETTISVRQLGQDEVPQELERMIALPERV
ncbi:MAG: DNA repair protein RecN [bacterium]